MARDLTIGIKIGTDLKPFLDSLDTLKTRIKSLETEGKIFDTLAEKTDAWGRSLTAVNTTLSEITRHLSSIQLPTGVGGSMGGINANMSGVVAAAAAAAVAQQPVRAIRATGPVHRPGYTLPVKLFSPAHQEELKTARSLISSLDARQLSDITAHPDMIRAQGILRRLQQDMAIDPSRLSRQEGKVAGLRQQLTMVSNPAFVNAFAAKRGIGIEAAREHQETVIGKLTAKIARQETLLRTMERGNQAISATDSMLGRKLKSNNEYLHSHGMTIAGAVAQAETTEARRQKYRISQATQDRITLEKDFDAAHRMRFKASQRRGLTDADLMEHQLEKDQAAAIKENDRRNLRASMKSIGRQRAREIAAERRERRLSLDWDSAHAENATRDRAAIYEPWKAAFDTRLSQANEVAFNLREDKRWKRLSPTERRQGAAILRSLTKERDALARVRDGETVQGYEHLTSAQALAAHKAVTSALGGVSSGLTQAKGAAGLGDNFKKILGFGTAVAAVHTLIGAMKQLYRVALDVEGAFASVRAEVSKISNPNERRSALGAITSGMMEDAKRTGMAVTETAKIHSAVYFGAKGTDEQKKRLARTITNLQFTGSLNSDETLGSLASFTNAGFDADDQQRFLEMTHALQGRMRLDPQRMRAFLSATTANLPGMGNVASWEDIKAWSLQEAAGTRDMVMGSKLNRIQIALQNGKTLQRLSGILGNNGKHTEIGGEDIASIVNNGNPMQTLGKLQSLYERGLLSEGQVTQIGQTIDMWNSPGTIQVLKGGLEPYRKMLRESELMSRAGIVTTDAAAKEQASSMGAGMDRLAAAFKDMLMSMSPVGEAFKSVVNGLASLLSSLSAHSKAISAVTSVVLGLISTIAISKGIQGSAALGSMISNGVTSALGAGTPKEWAKLGLGALGGASGLIAGGVISAGVWGINKYIDTKNERLSKQDEANNLASQEAIVKTAEVQHSYYSLKALSDEYRALQEQGKGASQQALALKDRIIRAIAGENSAERKKLETLIDQTGELEKQLRIKEGNAKADAKTRVDAGVRSRMLRFFLENPAFDQGTTGNSIVVNNNDTKRNLVNAMYQQVQLAKEDRDPEIRSWGETHEKGWGALGSNATDDQKANYAKNAIADLTTRLGKAANLDPFVLRRGTRHADVSTLQDRIAQEAAASGGSFARIKEGFFDDNWKDYYEADAKDKAALTSARADQIIQQAVESNNDVEFITKLAGLSTWKTDTKKPVITSDDLSNYISDRRRKYKNSDSTGKRLAQFDATIAQVQTNYKATGEGKLKSHASVNGYSTKTNDGLEALKSASQRDKIAGMGGEEFTMAEFTAKAMQKLGPDTKGSGVPADVSDGKDPYSVIKRVMQSAKMAAQNGDIDELANILSNPTFDFNGLMKLAENQHKEIVLDNKYKMQDTERQLADVAFKADNAALRVFFSRNSLMKLHSTAIQARSKLGGYDKKGVQLLAGDDDIKDAVLARMGAVPDDPEAEQLYHLKAAHETAKDQLNKTTNLLPEHIRKIVKDNSFSKEQNDIINAVLPSTVAKQLEKERKAVTSTRIDITKFQADSAYNHATAGIADAKLRMDMGGLFGTDRDRQRDLAKLTDMEINAEREKLSILMQEPTLLKEQNESRRKINELLFKQISSLEQTQRALISTAEGRSFSASVVGEMVGGDASQRSKSLRSLTLGTLTKGLTKNVVDVFDSLDAKGGPGNPLATMGRMLFDPLGEVSNANIQKSMLSATEMNTLATQQNTQAISALYGILGGGASPVAGATSSISAPAAVASLVTGDGALPLVGANSTLMSTLPLMASMTPPGAGLSTPAILAVGGAGVAAGAITPGVSLLDTEYGRIAVRSTTSDALPEIDPVTGMAYPNPMRNDAYSGLGQVTHYAQMGFMTRGINPFSQTNNVNGKNVVGGFWKTDANGKSTGQLDKGNVAMAGLGVAAGIAQGYYSQQGNGRAAQNYQALSGGLMATASMVAMFNPVAGAAVAAAGMIASLAAGSAAAKHKAEEQTKAYEKQENDMAKLLAIAEEQRKSVGLAAERILSSRADVGNAFQGVAASAFLSGRYAQTAPTIQVQQLVVQANNPAELSAALAQGVSREIRRGG